MKPGWKLALIASVGWVGIWFAWTARAEQPMQPEPASGYETRPTAFGSHHMVVTAHPLASRVADQVLAGGGHAVDAAIAAQAMLNLVEPQSSGIGGGGFMLVWDARERRVRAYDGRETAPATAKVGRFQGPEGKPMAFHEAAVGGRSVGTPGLVAMLELAHRHHGRLAWRDLFQPAIDLAERGFPVTPRLHKLLMADPFLRQDVRAGALFYQADGSPIPVGGILRNPDLARSLRLLAEGGAQEFYQGALAEQIVAAVGAHPSAPGDLSLSDFAVYRAKERMALCRDWHVHKVCGMPPPSSGGIAVLQMLGLLEDERWDFFNPLAVSNIHAFSEAGRLVFADRAAYLGDPDFADVPVSDLLDRAYLERRREALRPDRSLGRAAPGLMRQRETAANAMSWERPSTTHISVVDAEGNGVALTSSIEDVFGSRLMVGGFLLNNQLTDFSFLPAAGGEVLPNRVEPGKRPLSSMAPTLVMDQDQQLVAVLGSPGGSRIINYVAKALIALFDWKLSPESTLALPHFGSRNGPTELEVGQGLASVGSALESMGHQIQMNEMTSGLHLIFRQGQVWQGAADPRREGLAVGR